MSNKCNYFSTIRWALFYKGCHFFLFVNANEFPEFDVEQWTLFSIILNVMARAGVVHKQMKKSRKEEEES